MAQKRKRANAKQPVKQPVKQTTEKSKGVLKLEEAVKKQLADNPYISIFKDFPIRPLGTPDANVLKELFTLSNNVAALMKNYADTDLQVKASEKFITGVKKGEIKAPLMVRASPNLFIPMTDMDKAIENVRGDIKILEQKNAITRGQIEHRYEEYVNSLIRVRQLMVSLIGDKEQVTLSSGRSISMKDQDKIIFEKEFNDEMKKAELEEINKQVKESIEKDKAKKAKIKIVKKA